MLASIFLLLLSTLSKRIQYSEKYAIRVENEQRIIDTPYQPVGFELHYQKLGSQTKIIQQLMNQTTEYLSRIYSLQHIDINEITKTHKCYNQDIRKSDKDIVVIVTRRFAKENWLAKAGACVIYNGRPIAAQLTFNVRYLQKLKLNKPKLLGQLGVILHEFTHILGFSKKNFKKSRMYSINNGLPSVNDSTLIHFARVFFECPTIESLPMEQNGRSGTQGSHWERQVFADELMTGQALQNFGYSNFTLLLLQATGNYRVDLNYASSYNWGKGQGCKALDRTCDNPTICKLNPNKQKYCSEDNYRIQKCRDHTQLNQCPLPQLKIDCRWEGNRCFDSDTSAHCLKAICVNNTIEITHNKKTYQCINKNQVIQIARSQISCPNIETFCGQVCTGNGHLHNGGCICNIGFKGTSCEQFFI